MEVTFKKKNKNIKEDVRINLQQQLKLGTTGQVKRKKKGTEILTILHQFAT